MDKCAIYKKFGDDYIADEHTFILGSDLRFTTHFAERFEGLTVLETCTGAGFTTIPLARMAKHVFTVEIDPGHQEQAIANVKTAGLSDRVTFIRGDILDESILKSIPAVDAAFLDPDWAVTGPDHVYRFIGSNTRPSADTLLERIFRITSHIAMILPPYIHIRELAHLPKHERESLFMGREQALFCLYFGDLMRFPGSTEFRIPEESR
jgi:tRNA1(Val) A37 N6-methylase TrmN6